MFFESHIYAAGIKFIFEWRSYGHARKLKLKAQTASRQVMARGVSVGEYAAEGSNTIWHGFQTFIQIYVSFKSDMLTKRLWRHCMIFLSDKHRQLI